MTIVSKAHEEFRSILENEEEKELTRYIDLCVVWKRKLTGEVIYKGGGRWDRVTNNWSPDPPKEGKIIYLTETQYEPAVKAAYWMQEFKAGRARDFFSMFLYGNRAAGKTFLASVLLFTLVIEFPKMMGSPTIAWQVSSSHSTRDELDRNIQDLFPFKGDWYTYREHPKHEYRFVNGAVLVNVSADDAESLKRGRVDFVLFNEAQKVGGRVAVHGIGRVKDKGGFALFTSNPPTNRKSEWIYNLWDAYCDARTKGITFPIQFVNMDAKFNENIDALVSTQIDDMIRIIDPINASADIEGLIKPVGARAYWSWDKVKHIKECPKTGDITENLTRRKEGQAFKYVAGADFQFFPHNAGTIYKVFGTIDKPILWAVDEILVDESDEDDLLDAIEDLGYTYKDILWIGDASGDWQSGTHKKESRDSYSVFRSRKWNIIPPQKKKTKIGKSAKNPPIEQRVRLINKLLDDGQLFVDPNCKKLALALKECKLAPTRSGYGSKPEGIYAHITDTVGYAAWFTVPTPMSKVKPGLPGIIIPPLTADQQFEKFINGVKGKI